MSENVEIVRQVTELLSEGNFDALFALYDPDGEFCDLRSAVDTPEVLRGVEAVKSLLGDWSEAWEGFGAQVFEYIDADPYVICDTRWHGTGHESRVPIEVRQADVFGLRSGKITRVTLGYASTADALKAVARSPEMMSSE